MLTGIALDTHKDHLSFCTINVSCDFVDNYQTLAMKPMPNNIEKAS